MKKPTSEYSLDHPSSGLSRRGFLGVVAGTAATAMTPAALLAQANDGMKATLGCTGWNRIQAWTHLGL